MTKKLKLLRIYTAIFVSLQFGILLPLSPVLAQTAQEASDSSSAIETVDLENNSTLAVSTTTDGVQMIKKESSMPEPKGKIISYANLMRQLKDVRTGSLSEKKGEVLKDFESFLDSEKDKLSGFDVSSDKKKAYLNRLEGQMKGIDDREIGNFEKIWEKIKSFFGYSTEELPFDQELSNKEEKQDVKIPENPAQFSFNNEEIKVNKLGNITADFGQKIDKSIKGFIKIEEAKADDGYLPTISDVQSDNGEIIINSTIKNLANDLHNNPVEIYNFVRANINYEPYYGAKKGNLGCLEEKVCNDVDSASLAISLLRASGIPAKYKKSIVVVSVVQLQKMLGLDQTVEARRTVYGIFKWNKVPVYSITGNPNVNVNLDSADFTNETYFALEWVFPEIYYDYDERGGNIDNTLDLSTVSTTESLQSLLQEEYKKQWIPLDVIFKGYNRIQKEIVADTANFNSENFWYGFYQYSGSLSPLNKYVADLQSATGKNVSSTAYQSYNESVTKNYNILPPTLPYVLGEGVDENGQEILPETWSVLPDIRKQQVKIQLKKSSDNQVVLEHTFFGSEINNKELNLFYEGATETDKQVIESYGGIHATPAELVDIRPYLLGDFERYDGTQNINIGDSLILRFEYLIKGTVEHDDEKFSTAGNQEGIYVVLSKVQEDPYLDTNSRILLRGNVGLAREYLKQIQNSSNLFEKSLDYKHNLNFSRAVVTQNRILNTVNGAPTTFDFKGLTIDSGMYINDWSNLGNYKTHRKDFRLLWGLEASYQEGQLFQDVAGLEGISTVKGLQYGYQHPETYAIHKITSSTPNYQGLVNSFSLTDNTKQNMITDIEAGNTILTPDKFISQGAFNGILYASIKPDWTGTYAIGEQSQMNGGWTINQYTLTDWDDVDTNHQYAFEYDNGPNKFIYKDNKDRNVLCNILTQTYNQIVGGNIAPGWNISQYGKPCLGVEQYNFGDHNHQFILSTDGAYFNSQSDNYDYWIRNAMIVNLFQQKLQNEVINIKKLYPYWGTYRYDGSTFWTYTQAIYNPADKHVYSLDKDIGIRYFSIEQLFGKYLPSLLGFPTMDKAVAASYQPKNSTGYYQKFINGTFYHNNQDIAHLLGVITFGPLDIKIDQAGGSSVVGFPLSDPIERNGYRYQLLQSENDVLWNLADNSASLITHIPYNCTLYGDYADHWYTTPLMTLTHLHGIFDSGISLIEGFETLLKNGFSFALQNPGLIANFIWPDYFTDYKNILDYLSSINYPGIIKFFRSAPSQLSQALIQEYDTSFGKKGCSARQWYLEGRLAGEFLMIYLPMKNLSLADRLKAVKWAGETPAGVKVAAYTGKWIEYRKAVELAAEGLEVPGKFTKERITETLLGEFNETTGKFKGEGFHSANALKAGMENKAIEVWNIDKNKVYSTYADVLKDARADGLFEVRIYKTNGWSEIKTFLPEQWSDQEKVDAIVEASSNRLPSPKQDQFLGIITKKGITIKIRGYFEDTTSEFIKHGFREP